MNRLAGEDSLYLRQHRDHPVDWYPWGPSAFAEAGRRDMPVLLSIGYSTCHWCHAMARDVFADPATAALINATVVAIKVDRDERPDIDHIYMKALRATTGLAGWPLTLLLLPDQRPFLAAAYLSRDAMASLMADLAATWRAGRPALEEQAAQLAAVVAARSRVAPTRRDSAVATPASDDPVAAAVAQLRASFDKEWGGFEPGPKFPRPARLELLLWAARHRPAGGSARSMLTTTLDAMAAGGIYDHLAGGFGRYATDREWRVPHFEKLLPDNAQLARVYLHAWQLTHADHYRQVTEETLGFLSSHLAGPGFSAGMDADAGGVEGGHYLWDYQEVRQVAGTEVCEWYGVTPGSSRQTLWRPDRAHLGRAASVEAGRRRLLAARQGRPAPIVDDRVITEWNAMAVAVFAEAGAALSRKGWVDAATETAVFLQQNLRRPDGRWCRAWWRGRARELAGASDLAWLIEAFTRLAEATGTPSWLDSAGEAADSLLALCWDADHGGVWSTGHDAPTLIARSKEIADGASPSANAIAAAALARLGALSGRGAYRRAAEGIVAGAGRRLQRSPARLAGLAVAADLLAVGPVVVAVPERRPDLRAVISGNYLPSVAVQWLPAGNGAVVCHGGACRPPVDDPDDLFLLLK